MEHLCVRCTRQALRSSSLHRRQAQSVFVRQLSASSPRTAGPIDLSEPIEGSEAPRSRPCKQQDTKSPDLGTPSFRITRQLVDSPGREPRSPSTRNSPGVLARRTNERSSNNPANVIRRTVGAASSQPPPGTVIARRTTAPRSSSPSVPRASGPPQRDPRRGPSSRSSNNSNSNTKRSRATGEKPDDTFDEYYEEDEDSPLTNYENELEASEANNGLPTQPIAYSPAEQTLEELRKDWPDTPLSATGLTEAVVQKLRWLARDLPHGYWTPRQVAERFVEGGLVRFENGEHKEKVMVWVERIMEERKLKTETADAAATAKNGEKTEDKRYVGVQTHASSQALLDTLIKGHYPALPEGQRPLIASVQRQLRNNETYGAADSTKLVGRINSLIESLQSQAAQQRAAAAAAEQKATA